jgi:hypothetical protein
MDSIGWDRANEEGVVDFMEHGLMGMFVFRLRGQLGFHEKRI